MGSRRALRIGTRGSRLALRQTELVAQALRERDPALELEVREVRTEGDRRIRTSLARIGGQGVFVKELEAALLRDDVDLAVHSLKDVPVEPTGGLTLAAFPRRADPRDALVSRNGEVLGQLPAGARVGTGSQRRAVQLRALRSDIEPVDIRGNVDTRVRKADEGDVEAVVLAAAGLERLGLLDRAAELLSPDVMLPAVGQGALALQARTDDEDAVSVLRTIDDAGTRLAVQAERAFLGRLGGGCRLPVGALAETEGAMVRVRGFISDEEGARLYRGEESGPAAEPESVGVRLAERLLAEGAAEFTDGALR